MNIRRAWRIYRGFLAVTLGVAAYATVRLESSPVSGTPLERAIGERKPDPRKISLKIEKSAYRLTVLYKGRAVKTYPVVLGRCPVADKQQEGDGCTPEGTYRVRALYPHKDWSKFIWLDYPNAAAWARFNKAKREGKLRPNATIGSEIGIHGVPEKRDELIDTRTNWTLGCISLKTGDIDELYRFTRVGTQVTIVH